MAGVDFSSAETCIFHPVLQLRAECHAHTKFPATCKHKLWHFTQSELLARIVAVFASIFAAIDAVVHLLSGLYKSCCLLSNSSSYTNEEVRSHFKKAASYTGIAIVGSIAGAIWPDVFKYFLEPPQLPFDDSEPPFSDPSDDGEDINLRSESISPNEMVPREINALAQSVLRNEEQKPFDGLRQFFRNCRLSSRRWFVHVFNGDKQKFKAVREALGDIIYRPIVRPLNEGRVKWLHGNEISDSIHSAAHSAVFSQGFLFHATSEKALEAILKTKRVEVRHEKAFCGAFASTKPEYVFGKCVLAFKRNVERLSSLKHGFTLNQNTYWAGFSKQIPVTESTLAYVILDSDSEAERKLLENYCEIWTGRKIEVILKDHIQPVLQQVEQLGMGIPTEWPEEGEEVGQMIVQTLKRSMQKEKANTVQVEMPVRVTVNAPVQSPLAVLVQQPQRHHAPSRGRLLAVATG